MFLSRLLVCIFVFATVTSCDTENSSDEDADHSNNPSPQGCYHLHEPPIEPGGIHRMEMPDGSICQVIVGPHTEPQVEPNHILIQAEAGADCDYVGLYTFRDPYSAYESVTPPPTSLCFHHPQPGTDQTPVTDVNSPPPNIGTFHHQPID